MSGQENTLSLELISSKIELIPAKPRSAPSSHPTTPDPYKNGYYYKTSVRRVNAHQGGVEDSNESERDWQMEWSCLVDQLQAAADDASTRIQLNQKMSELSKDFVSVAKRYGKLIIAERFLPDALKTVKPTKIGGVAGGAKFICRGILFKFPVDSYGIYGSDESAMKAAAHELLGVRECMQAAVEGLHVPLMCLIDYRGHRLIAMSILPLAELIYGSCDGGRNVYAVDEEMNSKMQLIGERLNLKAHIAGSMMRQSCIYGPADIEGHRGEDDRFYLIDFQRLMPPEWPNEKGTSAHLFRLLRPEFVKRYRIPLSSDAASSFSKYDPDMNVHNEEVKEATRILRERLIPSVSARLDALSSDAIKHVTIGSFLKRCGVNLRYLAAVRYLCRSSPARGIILMEMVARVIKDELKKVMRDSSKATTASTRPLKQSIIQFFNQIVCHSDRDKWWDGRFKQLLEEKYGSFGPVADLVSSPQPLVNLLSSLDLFALFHRIESLTGVRMSAKTLGLLSKSLRPHGGSAAGIVEFVEQDLEGVKARVKHNNVVADSDVVSLILSAAKCVGQGQSERLFRLGLKKLHDADTTDFALLFKICHSSHRPRLIDAAGARLEMGGESHERWFSLATLVHQMAEDDTGTTPSEQREFLFKCASDFYCKCVRLAKAAFQDDGRGTPRLPLHERDHEPQVTLLSAAPTPPPVTTVAASPLADYYYSWANLLYCAAEHVGGDEMSFRKAGKKYLKAFRTDPQRVPPESSQPALNQLVAALAHSKVSEEEQRDVATLVRLLGKPQSESFTELDLQQCPSMSDSFLLRLGERLTSSGPLTASKIRAMRLGTSAVTDEAFVKCWFPHLRHLDLRECRGITEVTLLAVSIRSPQLEHLNLSGCRISDGRNIPEVVVAGLLATEAAPVAAPDWSLLPFPSSLERAATPPSPTKKLPSGSSRAANTANSSFSGRSAPSAPPSPTKKLAAVPMLSEMPLRKKSPSIASLLGSSSSSASPSAVNSASLSAASTSTSSVWDRLFGHLPNLAVAVFSECRYLPDMAVQCLILKCPNLRELHLGGCTQLSSRGMLRIFQPPISTSISTPSSPSSPVPRSARDFHRMKWLARHAKTSSATSPELSGSGLSSGSSSGVSTPRIFSYEFASPSTPPVNGSPASASPFAELQSEFSLEPEPIRRSSDHKSLQLQVVDFTNCKNITDEILGHLAACCKDLQVIRCAGAGSTASFPICLRSVAVNCKHIRHLKFGKMSSLDDDTVVRLVQSCPLLEGFEVSHALALTSESIVYMSKVCVRLTTVGLSFCKQIGDDAIVAVAKNNRLTLRTLRIAGLFKITQLSISAIAEKCLSLQHLELDACEAVNDGAVHKLMMGCSDLRTLTLRDCPVSSATLDLVFVKQASMPTPALQSLQRISLAKSSAVTDSTLLALGKHAGAFKHLQYLNLTATRFSEQAFVAMARASAGVLRSLDLTGCTQVNDDALSHAAECLPLLDTLILDGCSKIGDSGILRLAASCGNNLRILSAVGLYKVTDVGIIKLAQSAPQLRSLDISFVYKVTDAGASKLVAGAKHLQCLFINGARQLTESFVDELIRKPDMGTCLVRLDMNSCSNIDRSFVFKLRQLRPDIEISFKG